MVDFNAFLEILKKDLSNIAEDLGRDYIHEIINDGTEFANKRKEYLVYRTQLLTEGKLTESEFKWLLRSDRNLIEMKAVKQRGLAVVQMNKIQDAIIGAVTGALLKSIKRIG